MPQIAAALHLTAGRDRRRLVPRAVPGRRQLITLQSRWRLAGEWRRLLAHADGPPVGGRWRVRPRLDAVADARCEIERLIGVLCSTEPIDPRGLGRARRLIRDGAGPVYVTSAGPSLAEAVAETVALLTGAVAAGRGVPASRSPTGRRRDAVSRCGRAAA